MSRIPVQQLQAHEIDGAGHIPIPSGKFRAEPCTTTGAATSVLTFQLVCLIGEVFYNLRELFRVGTFDEMDLLGIFEYHKCGHGSNIVGSCEILLLVGVDFGERDLIWLG